MLKRAIGFLMGANVAQNPDAWGHGFAVGMVVGMLFTFAFVYHYS